MKKKFLKQLGSRIRQIRKEKGFTQVELAEGLGIDQPSIPRIENGIVNPSIYLLKEICGVLGIELEELFREL